MLSGLNLPVRPAITTVPTTAAITTPTSTAAAPTTTTAATATRTGFLRACLIDGQRPTPMLLTMKRSDRLLGLRIRTHLHKAEPLASTGLSIRDHLRTGHAAMRREQLVKVFVIH